jgi:flagellar hook assembly protein FlgD
MRDVQSVQTRLQYLDNMVRQLSRHRALGAAAFAAAAFFGTLLIPSAASAQSTQIFINTAFVASASPTNTGCNSFGNPARFICSLALGPTLGANISNDPEIQFASNAEPGVAGGRCNIDPLSNSNPNIPGTNGYNVCNNEVYLCAQVGFGQVSGSVALDQVEFEVFRYVDGANPLDPGSTPPLKTFFIDNPGSVDNVAGSPDAFCDGNGNCDLPKQSPEEAYCVLWDGSQNVQGGTGKINGQYGFRVTVQTNQVGASGNITITQTRAYPSGATEDSGGTAVASKNIVVDVTDVHVVRSTPTVVGQITGVSAEPYNFTYRLSKDATMYLTINQSVAPFQNVRTVIPGLPRTGEGALGGTGATPLVNGDSWDGRDNFGNVMPPGSYLAVFQANSADQYDSPNAWAGIFPSDLSDPTTTQIAIDPLQITDIRVQPLLGGSTSLAVLSYQLTEPATVYVDVYPPGTEFCFDSGGIPALSDVNSTATDNPALVPAKNFSASSDGCATTAVAPLRSIVQQQNGRAAVLSFWDGRDKNGNLLGDGDYVFVIYASLPSQAGTAYNGGGKRVWTSLAKSGFISVLRGLVGITQITPSSSIIGSSPAVSGLSPFTFRYQLSRDAIVSLKIFDSSGSKLVKTIVNQETRPGLFNNSETWSDGNDDNGLAVASGTYLVQLTATDGSFPSSVSTTTALFPLDNFRITDVSLTPLLAGASDQVTLTYQLSQPMFMAWNIYPAGSVIVDSTGSWPPCAATNNPPGACTSASVVSPPPSSTPVSPIVTFKGMRAGRLKISEFWDGRDINGLFVPDGSYVYTLTAQSTTTPQYFPTDRISGSITVARGSIFFTSFNVTPDIPQLFNSSNTITLDPFTISYVLTRQSSVTIQVLNTSIPPQVLRTVISGGVRQNGILLTDVWDGRDDKGNFLPFSAGGTPYLVRVVAQDIASQLLSPSTAQQTVLYDPLRVYDLAVTPNTGNGAIIAYQVSEPMKVAIKVYKPGTNFDLSGNPQPPEVDAAGHYVSLVRRIVGIRPSRTPIQDTWDGRDFTLQPVPDGTYKFKIIGSTDGAAIDSVTGDVLIPSELADDRLTDDLPSSTNGASSDPVADFEANSFVYPNPITGPSGTFSIYSPFHARVLLKLYTVAGQLILTHDFGDQAPSFQNGPITWVWSKANQSGRTIARGIYYAVIRIEETEGGGNVLQTVKKVLVP